VHQQHVGLSLLAHGHGLAGPNIDGFHDITSLLLKYGIRMSIRPESRVLVVLAIMISGLAGLGTATVEVAEGAGLADG